MSDEINVRKYLMEDCKEIIELFKNTVHLINARDYNKEQLNSWAPEEIDYMAWNKSLLEHYSIIAEKSSIIVGFGDINDSGYLDRLYVHKDHQGKGIATKIAEELENHVLGNGIQKIVTHASITAKTFFEKRGYEAIKEQAVECRGRILTNFVMEKNFGK